MRRTLAALAAGLLPLVLAVPLAAQEPGAQEALTVTGVDTSDAPAVSAVLTPPSSLAGSALTPEQITITEDGEPREAEVRRLPADELEVLLLVDTSGSMRAAMAIARAAATSFVESLPGGIRMAVLGFGTEVTTITDFTADRAAVTAAIATLRPSGETALYDALARALRQFTPREGTRRAVVLLSDGGDTVSTTGVESVEQQLAEAGTDLFAIELVTPESDGAVLRSLADAAGGRVASAERPDDLAAVYGQVRSLLVNQYAVRFEATGTGPTTFGFRVEADGASAAAEQVIELPGIPAPIAPAPADPAAAAAAAPEPPVERPARLVGSGAALLIGAGLWFVALVLLMLVALLPGERRAQLRGVARGSAAGRTGLTSLANHASDLAELTLRRRGKERGLSSALERAGMNLRPGEFVVLVICGATAGLILGSLVGGPLLGVLVAAGMLTAGRMVLKAKGAKRQEAFAEQLGESLQLLASSLRAGYSLMQAVDAVAREAEAPTSEEFHRLVVETRLGRDIVDALRAMDSRLGNEDFSWVLQAIEINREVGGDLAEVLDTVAGTIRDRDQIRRQVKTLSAEGRMSAYVLMALPFAVGLFMSAINPSYMREFTSNGPAGYGMLVAGGLMLTVGGLWLRSMVKIHF